MSSMTNGYEVYENEEYLESMSIKEEPISEEEAPSDLPLDCMLCAKCFRTTSGLRAHVVTDHNYKTVKRKSVSSPRSGKTRCSSSDSQPSDQKRRYICSMCRRVFVTSTDLRVHETCHSKFFCFACNARFDTFKEVTKHRQRCKVKPQTVKLKTLSDVMKERAQLALLEVNVDPEKSSKSDELRDNILLKIYKTDESTEKPSDIGEVVEKAVVAKKKVMTEEKDDDNEDKKYKKIEAELRIAFGMADNENTNEESESTERKIKTEILKDTLKCHEPFIDPVLDTKKNKIPETEKEAKNLIDNVKIEKVEIEINKIDINKEVKIEVEHMQDSETSFALSETNSDYNDTKDQDGENYANDANDSDFTDKMKEKVLVNNENDEQSKSEVCDSISGAKSDVKSNTFVIERIEEIV